MQDIINALIRAVVQEAVPHVVQAVQQAIGGNGGQPQAQQGFVGQQPQTAASTGTGFGQPISQGTVQQATNPFGAQPQAPAQQPQVTPEMIQALVMPLVQNEQIKNVLAQRMAAMGIQNLSDATPAQLPALYAAFKEVEQQAIQAGMIGGGAQPQQGQPSLI